MDKRYLGAKASDPTTDNQGQALAAGAVFYNTTTNKVRTWTGSVWTDGITAIAGVSSFNGATGAVTSSFPISPINTNTTAAPWTTYLIYGACTLTLPTSPAIGSSVGVLVLTGVTGAAINPGAEKIRNVAGSMNVDISPFDRTLTYQGATYGWV